MCYRHTSLNYNNDSQSQSNVYDPTERLLTHTQTRTLVMGSIARSQSDAYEPPGNRARLT